MSDEKWTVRGKNDVKGLALYLGDVLVLKPNRHFEFHEAKFHMNRTADVLNAMAGIDNPEGFMKELRDYMENGIGDTTWRRYILAMIEGKEKGERK